MTIIMSLIYPIILFPFWFLIFFTHARRVCLYPITYHVVSLSVALYFRAHLSNALEPSFPCITHTCRNRILEADYHLIILNMCCLGTMLTHRSMSPVLCCRHHLFMVCTHIWLLRYTFLLCLRFCPRYMASNYLRFVR